MKSKSVILLAGAAALVLLGVALFVLGRSDSAGGDGVGGPGGDPFRRPNTQPVGPDDAPQRVNPVQVLDDYKRWAQFPPNSRPLSKANVDLIELNHIPVPYRPVRFEAEKKTKLGAYSCRLQAKYHTVFEGEPQDIYLSCHKGTDGRPPEESALAKLQVSEAFLQKVTYKDFERLPSTVLSVNDDGRDGDKTAGDRLYTYRFAPSKSDWGHMLMTVRFKIPEDPSGRDYELKAQFFASPKAPAQFTGRFSDEAKDGSLVINVEMRILKAGKYSVQANLKNDDKYIAVAKKEVELKPGVHSVPLLFFGRIFHLKEANGPYILTGLYAYRDNSFITDEILNSPNSAELLEKLARKIESKQAKIEPEKEIVPPYSDEYRTAQYRYGSFSDKEYDSPRKREEIEALTKQAQESPAVP